MKLFQSILVPTDFSPRAEEAARVAAELAQKYESRLTLLHVHDPVPYELPAGYVANMPSHLDRVFDELNARLAALAEVARGAGARHVDTRLLQGRVAEEIVVFAKNFDLIVMSTRGRTGLEHLLLGSVAERVVQLASCAVLVIRSHPE